ncbi:MAG TPA: alpha-ketoglutarate-dependent dioxygenase AlkB [Nitrosarchaeum sp.]|nr:alpha-ketoglutarate-dependent dioxygenase AlkB [Nitrosarchaeum sp.]
MQPDIISVKNFCSKKRCELYLKEFENMQFATDEESAIILRGQRIKVPRKQTSFGEKGTYYKFTGIKLKARSYDEAPFLRKLQKRVNNFLLEENVVDEEEVMNFSLVNLYRNGKDYIGYHSDSTEGLRQKKGEVVISSLSFGATRDFYLQNKSTKEVHKYSLESGELFVMKGLTNMYYKHSVPKRLKVSEPRYNITLRSVIPLEI